MKNGVSESGKSISSQDEDKRLIAFFSSQRCFVPSVQACNPRECQQGFNIWIENTA